MDLFNIRTRPQLVWMFRSKGVWIRSALIAILILSLFHFLTQIDNDKPTTLDVVERSTRIGESAQPQGYLMHERRGLQVKNVQSKFAFATLLAGEDEYYFIATRILTYQFLHAPETRNKDKSIPFLVLVTHNISEDRRERLRRDGAIIVPVKRIEADWLRSNLSNWQDVLTKLRLWELVQFDRICFVDGDTILLKPIDGVFYDNATALAPTGFVIDQYLDDEAPLPPTYAFAGVHEMNPEHGFPPTAENNDLDNGQYFNAGFFILQPSLAMQEYYFSLMKLVNRFDPICPEQNLLNYAHRWSGNMPWKPLNNTWNIHYPTQYDVEHGVHSIHDKWWTPEHPELISLMLSWRWRMEGFFQARDKYGRDKTAVWGLWKNIVHNIASPLRDRELENGAEP